MKYSRHGFQNYSLRVQTSTLRRVPDYDGIFLNFHWIILGMIVKTTVYVFRGALWERLSFFWEFFKRVVGLWAIIVRTSGEKLQQRCPNCPKKFRQFCQNCILNVGEFFEEFFCKNISFQLILDFEAKFLDLPAKSFQQSCQNCFLRVQWTTLRTIIVFSEIFESFWFLSDNCPDLWLKISAAFPNVHSTCPKEFFVFFCEWFSCFI